MRIAACRGAVLSAKSPTVSAGCLGKCCPLCKKPGCFGGCCVPSFDPNGDRIFTPKGPKYHPVPGCKQHHRPEGVTVSPRKVIAPVGAEVVMLAGVCDKAGRLHSGQRVEWMVASGGVGSIIAVGGRNANSPVHLVTGGPQGRQRLRDRHDSPQYLMLTRGTPTLDDDVAVLRGQAWITVSSPIEGVSHVTAFAPDVYGWDKRQTTAAVYWVDAQWTFPPPAVNPIGTRHNFTTIVMRHTDREPVTGCAVRYEITSGPDAGFAPDGAKVIEVPTNDLGQASRNLSTPSRTGDESDHDPSDPSRRRSRRRASGARHRQHHENVDLA